MSCKKRQCQSLDEGADLEDVDCGDVAIVTLIPITMDRIGHRITRRLLTRMMIKRKKIRTKTIPWSECG